MKESPKNPPVGRTSWSSLSLSAFQNSPETKDTVWGVSASFLEQFFERAVKQSSAWRQGMTTRAVVASIIKPLTEASNAPYIVVAERIRGEPIRKPADVFVSHAWDDPFEVLVSALLSSADVNTSYWLDFFLLNQQDTSKTITGGIDDFKSKGLSGVRVAMMICHPWDNPSCFRRTRCIHAGFKATEELDVHLKIGLCPEDHRRLVDYASEHGGLGELARAIAEIDIEKTESYIKADETEIKDLLREAGPETVHKELGSALSRAYVEILPSEMLSFQSGFPRAGRKFAALCIAVYAPLAIACIYFAIVGPCSNVYFSAVSLLLGLIATIAPLGAAYRYYTEKLRRMVRNLGSQELSLNSFDVVKKELGHCHAFVARMAAVSTAVCVTVLLTTSMVAISMNNCQLLCNVVWVFVFALAVPFPIAVLQLQLRRVRVMLADEEVQLLPDTPQEIAAVASVSMDNHKPRKMPPLHGLLGWRCWNTSTAISALGVMGLFWSLALLVGLLAGWHPDLACAARLEVVDA